MRRLFSTFAHGPPGVGLLLMRVAGGAVLIQQSLWLLLSGPTEVSGALQVIAIVLGGLLIVGLWTPIVGAIVAGDALWNLVSSPYPPRWILLAALGAALALIGPGAWSLDARRYGWRRLEIPNGKHRDPP